MKTWLIQVKSTLVKDWTWYPPEPLPIRVIPRNSADNKAEKPCVGSYCVKPGESAVVSISDARIVRQGNCPQMICLHQDDFTSLFVRTTMSPQLLYG
jgi:hypothetical protein